MKLQETKGRFFITLPKSFISLLKWQKGQSLIVLPGKEGSLEVKELK